MKLSKRTSGHFLRLLILGIVLGTLFWELLEKIIALSGGALSLSVGPVGFDTGVLAVRLIINPGSFLGALGGYALFRRI